MLFEVTLFNYYVSLRSRKCKKKLKFSCYSVKEKGPADPFRELFASNHLVHLEGVGAYEIERIRVFPAD